MKILVHGRFYPSVGGIETIVDLLAREWTATGHEIGVVSNLPLPAGAQRVATPFRVWHHPGPLTWLRLVRWSQVVLHLNLSLRALWPHLLLRRPLIVSHQSCYVPDCDCPGGRDWRRRLKLRLMRQAANIAASPSIAAALPVRCRIIPNPYNPAVFHPADNNPRTHELLFVGRLVTEKGVDLLLTALASLEPPWNSARLTIVGDGPGRRALEDRVLQLGLAARARFLGALSQDRVADQMRRHKVLVVPSTYAEPFGVVALEGAACGCRVLGSDGGGLPWAMGPGGATFRRGEVADLARQLTRLLQSTEAPANRCNGLAQHLRIHEPRGIAREYVQVFQHPELSR